MEHESIHELAAAYALDALSDDERAAFEQHLAGCGTCSAEVERFNDTTYFLASAEEGPEPPPALRTRLLDAAGREQPRQSVVVLRPRRTVRLVAAVAAAFAALAIGLGAWAASLASSLDGERTALANQARAAAILADPSARRLALGESGVVVRRPNGDAVMVMSDIPEAPPGKTYEAWVIEPGGPVKAGLFEGGGQEIVLLEYPVSRGAAVAVTLEPDGGSDQPTGDVLFGSSEA